MGIWWHVRISTISACEGRNSTKGVMCLRKNNMYRHNQRDRNFLRNRCAYPLMRISSIVDEVELYECTEYGYLWERESQRKCMPGVACVQPGACERRYAKKNDVHLMLHSYQRELFPCTFGYVKTRSKWHMWLCDVLPVMVGFFSCYKLQRLRL